MPCIVILFLLDFPFTFLSLPVHYSGPARLERHCDTRKGTSNLAVEQLLGRALSTLQGCGSISKKSFRRVTLLLQQVLRCLNSSFRFPIGLGVEGTTSNMFEFPVFDKFSKLGRVILGAIVPAHHLRYTMSCNVTPRNLPIGFKRSGTLIRSGQPSLQYCFSWR